MTFINNEKDRVHSAGAEARSSLQASWLAAFDPHIIILPFLLLLRRRFAACVCDTSRILISVVSCCGDS